MRDTPELRLLFATDCSAACVRAGAAIAQLAGAWDVTTTLVHVRPPDVPHARARAALDAFLPELDRGHRGRRLLLDAADPVTAVADLCNTDRFDLALVPRRDRSGLGWFWPRSFRARLTERCTLPLWTAGARVPATRLGRPVQRVACLIDFADEPEALLALARRVAGDAGASLHALAVVPPVHEGTPMEILGSDVPVTIAEACARIDAMAGRDAARHVGVAAGPRGAELQRLLVSCEADVLLVARRPLSTGSWARSYLRDLDRLPCSVICVDPHETGMADWPFRSGAWPSARCHPLSPGRAPVPALAPEPAWLQSADAPANPVVAPVRG